MENSDDINVMQVLQAIAGAYFSVHVINLVNDTFYEYKSNDEITPFMKGCVGAAATMREIMENTVEDEFKDLALEFSDLNTIGQRIKGHTVLMEEFMCKNIGWVKEKFILMESDSNGDPTKVIHIIIEIGDQKRKEEFLKRLSYRDALTGCLNRLAYNERMADLYNKVDDDLIYMSFDVNCLKLINDNFGHNIGDELIVGSAECLKECLGRYGKVYRTGGDEFIAILKADSEDFKTIICELKKYIADWEGENLQELYISYGYAEARAFPGFSISELVKISERRMYEDKNDFYVRKCIDRRQHRNSYDMEAFLKSIKK